MRGVSLSGDGTRVALLGWDTKGVATREFRIWDLANPDKPFQVAGLSFNDGNVNGLSWSPDGQRLASGHDFLHKGPKNEVRIWSRDGKLVKSYPVEDVQGDKGYALRQLFFRSDTEMLVVGNKGGQRLALALNLQTGRVREVVRLPDHEGINMVAGFSADGRFGAVGPGPGNRIALFKMQDRGAPPLMLAGAQLPPAGADRLAPQRPRDRLEQQAPWAA